MDCVACGQELAAEDVMFHELDEEQKYPLCATCDETVDLRLLMIERIAEIEV